MSYSQDSVLDKFAGDFFHLYGAETEKRQNEVLVLLPETLAERLQLNEYIRIKARSDVKGDFVVNYGSEFLEKILDHVCGEVPVIECSLSFDYIKRQGFNRLIRDRFTFNGAIGEVENIADIRSQYILLSFRYMAQSDEQKEGMVSMWRDGMLKVKAGITTPCEVLRNVFSIG